MVVVLCQQEIQWKVQLQQGNFRYLIRYTLPSHDCAGMVYQVDRQYNPNKNYNISSSFSIPSMALKRIKRFFIKHFKETWKVTHATSHLMRSSDIPLTFSLERDFRWSFVRYKRFQLSGINGHTLLLGRSIRDKCNGLRNNFPLLLAIYQSSSCYSLIISLLHIFAHESYTIAKTLSSLYHPSLEASSLYCWNWSIYHTQQALAPFGQTSVTYDWLCGRWTLYHTTTFINTNFSHY